MIRAFEDAFGKEKVKEVLIEWSERSGRETAPKEIESFEGFQEFWKTTLSSENWNKILTCSFPKETGTRLECAYTECLYAQTMKEMNAQDLGYILFCHPDFVIAEAINPRLKLERTKTLMQGDEYCDHAYSWNE